MLRAAIALADEHGIGALTMRRLAQQLGVEAMSLYHHVPGKDRLYEGMLELVTAEMAVARPGGDWKAELRRSAMSAHDVLGRHPWAAGTISATVDTWPTTSRSSSRASRAASALRILSLIHI